MQVTIKPILFPRQSQHTLQNIIEQVREKLLLSSQVIKTSLVESHIQVKATPEYSIPDFRPF